MSSKSEFFEFSGGGEGKGPLFGVVTCDLRCPFSNSDELFQSKVICENLVRTGWACKSYHLNFPVGGAETPN